MFPELGCFVLVAVDAVLTGNDGKAAAEAEETVCCTTPALMTDILGVSSFVEGSILSLLVVFTAVCELALVILS